MGCTSSRQADEVSERPPTSSSQTPRALSHQHQPISTSALAPTTSRTAIRPSQSHSRFSRHANSNVSTPRGSSTPSRPAVLDTTYARPLQSEPPWSSKTRTWTPAQLRRERDAFFETRVTGRSEIWSAIQNAVDLLHDGQLENARTILEAAEVSLPTGSLLEGGFDSWGNLYRVPKEVLSDPTNLEDDAIDGETVVGSLPMTSGKEKGSVLDGNESDTPDNPSNGEVLAQEQRRDAKGKGKAVLDKDAMKVRCRLSDRGGPDVIVMLGKSQRVGELAPRILDEASIPNTARIKIAYLGKILNDKETLDKQGWKEGHVVQALVVGQAGS